MQRNGITDWQKTVLWESKTIIRKVFFELVTKFR